MFIPDPGPKRFPDPVSESASKNSSNLTQKIVTKLPVSEIWSGVFILDRDLYFLLIPYPGSQIRIRNTASVLLNGGFGALIIPGLQDRMTIAKE